MHQSPTGDRRGAENKEEHITKVVETSPTGTVKTTEYTYDVHGQLLTETVDGTVLNTMTYDNYGNIQSKNGVTYSYGDANWKDLLTGYGSKTISYDAQGNPTTYLGFPLTWSKGRQLASFGGRVFYTYNANGVRVSKVADGVTHTYQVEGSKILNEQYGTTTITPIYDNEDSVCGILYNEAPLFFLKNLQGDVIAITNKQGGVLARYTYDAWGKVLSVTDANGAEITSYSHIAHKNPYRYRGYYYDIDTELYYLQSRYYDPAVGRFINADDADVILVRRGPADNNLYGYCGSSPIHRADGNGNWYYSLEDFEDTFTGWKRVFLPKTVYGGLKLQYARYVDQYNYNVEKQGERQGEYIYGQATEPYANMKFASARVKKVGCGTIAIHNALVGLHCNPYYPDVLLQCFMNGLELGLGYLGIWPDSIGKFFSASNIGYRKTSDFSTWIKLIKSRKRGLCLFGISLLQKGCTRYMSNTKTENTVYTMHIQTTQA